MAIDIIDVILGRALSSTGQIDTYAAKAAKAAKDATAAATNAQTAVTNITTITEETQANNELAQQTVTQVQTALQDLQNAIDSMESPQIDIAAVQEEIKKIYFYELTHNYGTSATGTDYFIVYPDGEEDGLFSTKLYKQTGQNTDAPMTQKAVTDAISSEINVAITNLSNTINQRINNLVIEGGTGSINLGMDNEGHLIIVGPDGQPIAASSTEEELIEALVKSGSYHLKGSVGVENDYENKVTLRSQDALTDGSLTEVFDALPMFGGRKRCNVDDNGQITAFYGDANYAEDGSNGQVMVYQPKFYYSRVIIKSTSSTNGTAIRKEALILTPTKQGPNFKIHPLFINEDGEEVEYVLLAAYDGCVYDASDSAYATTSALTIDYANDKLSSIAGAKPITGVYGSGLTMTNAEQLARNRGAGWHITNLAAESAQQMLMMTEFGSPNGQFSLERGIVDITSVSGKNCTSLTGSTNILGNATGAAEVTTNEAGGNVQDYTVDGKRAISYRGVENPWGNIWRYVGGTFISGHGASNGGHPYVCKNFNYNFSEDSEDFDQLPFVLPAAHTWIYALADCGADYDWVYMPIECSSNLANSALPFGDNLWTSPSLNGVNSCLAGGSWGSAENAGMFYYGCDMGINESGNSSGAKLMFIPHKDSIYQANYTKWQALAGG